MGIDEPVVVGMPEAIAHSVAAAGSLFGEPGRCGKDAGTANTRELLQKPKGRGEVLEGVRTIGEVEGAVGEGQAKVGREKIDLKPSFAAKAFAGQRVGLDPVTTGLVGHEIDDVGGAVQRFKPASAVEHGCSFGQAVESGLHKGMHG